MKKAIVVLWFLCGMAWGQFSTVTPNLQRTAPQSLPNCTIGMVPCVCDGECKDINKIEAPHDVWTINVPVQQAAPAHLDVSTEFCSETVTMGHTTKYFRDIFPEECRHANTFGGIQDNLSDSVKPDGPASESGAYSCGADGRCRDLVTGETWHTRTGTGREPKLVDVPAVPVFTDEELRARYDALGPSAGLQEWTCKDESRIVLKSEDGKHHCIDFSLIEPHIHQSSAY